MVLYHLLYDLEVFYGFPIGLFTRSGKLFQIATASLFLLLVGISFSLSWHQQEGGTVVSRYPKYARRGFLILSWAMTISLVTYLFDPGTYVRFGILHLIGFSAFLLPFLTPLGLWNILPGLLLIALHTTVSETVSSSPLFLPLGVVTPGFSTVDYFPLVPWFGVILLGYSAGRFIYQQMKVVIRIPQGETRLMRSFALPGRHSLLIYLLHQPVLLFFLRILLGKADF